MPVKPRTTTGYARVQHWSRYHSFGGPLAKDRQRLVRIKVELIKQSKPAASQVSTIGAIDRLTGHLTFNVASSTNWRTTTARTAAMSLPRDELLQLDLPVAASLEAAFDSVLLVKLVLFAGLCGLITTWNALFFASTRLVFAMGRGRMLPETFAKVHPRYGSPSWPCCLLQSSARWARCSAATPSCRSSAPPQRAWRSSIFWLSLESYACGKTGRRKSGPIVCREASCYHTLPAFCFRLAGYFTLRAVPGRRRRHSCGVDGTRPMGGVGSSILAPGGKDAQRGVRRRPALADSRRTRAGIRTDSTASGHHPVSCFDTPRMR